MQGGYASVCILPESFPVAIKLHELGFTIKYLAVNQYKLDIDMYEYIVIGFSAGEHLDSSYPPCFIWTCKDDNVVPSINSYPLARGLFDLNIPNYLCLYEGNVHGYELGSGSPVDGCLEELLLFYNELH